MSVPKTPKEFEYDLWTTKNGEYMVRIKATGEICEVDSEIMRFLRAEEKRMRRTMDIYLLSSKQIVKEPILSLDSLKQEVGSNLPPLHNGSQGDPEGSVLTNILLECLLAELTPNQIEVYKNCILSGKNFAEYAREAGLTRQYIQKCIMAIRKKAKKFLSNG